MDAGSAFLTTGVDIAGNPRVLDGDLDGGMVVDMGAHELGNVALSVMGNAVPGGTLTVTTTGTAGLQPYLVIGDSVMSAHPGGSAVGRSSASTLLPPWGSLLVALPFATQVIAMAPIPGASTITIPPTLPVPMEFVFQTVAFGTPLPSWLTPGNFSNPVTVEIR